MLACPSRLLAASAFQHRALWPRSLCRGSMVQILCWQCEDRWCSSRGLRSVVQSRPMQKLVTAEPQRRSASSVSAFSNHCGNEHPWTKSATACTWNTWAGSLPSSYPSANAKEAQKGLRLGLLVMGCEHPGMSNAFCLSAFLYAACCLHLSLSM